MIRWFILLLLWLSAAPALAQTSPAAPPAPAEAKAPAETSATVRVNLETSEGKIVLDLENERAPVTTANFLRYVDNKWFDGASFYRAVKTPGAADISLIQGGIRDPKHLLAPIAHEPTTVTGLSHVDGAISMARGAPGSAVSDFFIIIGGMTGLDAHPDQSGDNLGFAVFGHVAEGMDVVRRIVDGPISTAASDGDMRGEMLAQPVRIISARRAVPLPEAPKPATVRVRLQTSKGAIVLELEKERAPITTANFLRYVDAKRLDGTVFYRASKVIGAPDMGLIQGGLRSNDPKRTFPPIKLEPTTRTGLSHTDGTISMARAAPGTARGDFFIIVGSMTSLDADPTQSGDNLGYAAFGNVVEGMDVVRSILAAPTSLFAGDGAMFGQMLATPVRIISGRRVP